MALSVNPPELWSNPFGLCDELELCVAPAAVEEEAGTPLFEELSLDD